MSRKATPSQAMEAIEIIRSYANKRQDSAIDVLESYVYNGHGLNEKLNKAEERNIKLEAKLHKLRKQLDKVSI